MRLLVCRSAIRAVHFAFAVMAIASMSSAQTVSEPAPVQGQFLGELDRPLLMQQGIVNPADQQRTYTPSSQPASNGHVPSYELPAVTVVGQAPSTLGEEERVGSYQQPRWTTDRRFSETRVYVRPEGAVEFEYWFIPTVNRKGASEIKQQFELELGLPHRFQVDFYLIPIREGSDSRTFVNNSVEVRYALADWGKIWGNPTLYLEYTFGDNSPDAIEGKLLLGDELAPRWHWGANLVWEHDTAEDMENSYEFNTGISYTVIDEKFSIGAEEKAAFIDVHNHRGHLTDNLFLGPSMQFRPMPQVHIDIAPLVGLTHETPALQAFFVVGYDW